MTLKKVEDLIYVYSNIRLLLRNLSKYKKREKIKLWDMTIYWMIMKFLKLWAYLLMNRI